MNSWEGEMDRRLELKMRRKTMRRREGDNIREEYEKVWNIEDEKQRYDKVSRIEDEMVKRWKEDK